MADNVTRVVTADVYAWMTPVEGVPGRWHHNTARRGEEIEVSAEEAKRGEGLGFLVDPESVELEEFDVDPDDEDADEDDEDEDEEDADEDDGLAIVVTSDGVEHVGVLPASAAAAPEADTEDEPEALKAPPRAAAKAAWVDFAEAKGADRAEAEAMSKDNLVASYGV